MGMELRESRLWPLPSQGRAIRAIPYPQIYTTKYYKY